MNTGYKVGDAMTFSPVVLSPEETIKNCAKVMEEHHVSAILVVGKNEELQGIVTEKDIVRKIIAKGIDPYVKKISSIMETDMPTIGPDSDLSDAMKKMSDFNVRHLPVKKSGKLVGLITGKDILKIQPHLFEILVEKIELKEEHRKPIDLGKGKELICDKCNKDTNKLYETPEGLVCSECLED